MEITDALQYGTHSSYMDGVRLRMGGVRSGEPRGESSLSGGGGIDRIILRFQ